MSKVEIEREQKQIRNKRTGRTRTILGWACLILGVMDLFGNIQAFNYSLALGLQSTILPFLMACLGAWLIKSTRKSVSKWDKYDELINKNGNTSLRMISRKTGIPLKEVRKDMQEMINNGFFKDEANNIGAYINGEYDILIMMKNGMPMESIQETIRREETEAKADAAGSDKPAQPRVWDEGDYANAIAIVASDEKDPEVVESLRSIEASLRKIDRLIERKPKLADSEGVRQLRDIYLPKTMELVKKLWTEDAGPAAMLEIKGILNTCATAYGKIVDKLYEREDEDTLIDIKVLEQIFAKEGLLDSDFDIE
ncbi:MAG: hypothetical protein ACSW8G_03105 [Bacillota bacterium]